jgi:hypothetical protein
MKLYWRQQGGKCVIQKNDIVEELPPAGWVVVYDLATDQETISQVQRATLTTKDFGVVPEVALLGSDEWWAAIEDGRIPKHEVTGSISRLFMTGHGDWPEFELDSNGTKTTWTRLGNQVVYAEGKGAKIEYVMQKLRRALLNRGEQKQVLRVLVRR